MKPTHKIVSRAEWIAARNELLVAEKALTRQSDELVKKRIALPWVCIDKAYTFETEAGSVTLADLFKGRSQLIVYHFMFGPEFTAGCASCSGIADGFNGIVVHLENHDVAFSAISRAPLEKLLAYKQRMHWDFPWASSFASDFNFDFNVSFSAEQQSTGGINYNYRDEAAWQANNNADNASATPTSVLAKIAASSGTDVATYIRERPGMSAFILEDGVVYHTYSAYARGLDALWGMYPWFDRAPKGRNEDTHWHRRHDEYAAPTDGGSCCGE